VPKEEWRQRALARGGRLVVWIEQSTDPNLLAQNSSGVCHALTVAWIEHYTGFTDDRSEFVNSFRRNEGQRQDGTSIPRDYIEQQELYQSTVQAYNATLQTVKQLKNVPLEAKKQLLEGLKVQQRSLYGEKAVVTPLPSGTSVTQAVNTFPIHPCYVALSFRAGESGHVVGFELRPDVYVSGNYPEFYEFFDANLGLFAFSSRASMLDFFVQDVWPAIYADHYAGCKFRTAVTAITPGVGFGEDPSVEEQLAIMSGESIAPVEGVETNNGAIIRVEVGKGMRSIAQIREVVVGCLNDVARDGVEELISHRDFPTPLFPELPLYRGRVPQLGSDATLLVHFLDTLASPQVSTRMPLRRRVEFIRYIHYIGSQVQPDKRFREPWVWRD
jgi:hypothetical protein